MKLLLLLFFSTLIIGQTKFEENIDKAYQNAKKGIYYALSNIPEKKKKLDSDLVENDKLIAKVVLTKEINGVRIESKGYHSSYQAVLIVYKSKDSLAKEGYIKEE